MAINQNDYHYWEGSFKGLLPNEILKLSDEDFQTLYEDFKDEGIYTEYLEYPIEDERENEENEDYPYIEGKVLKQVFKEFLYEIDSAYIKHPNTIKEINLYRSISVNEIKEINFDDKGICWTYNPETLYNTIEDTIVPDNKYLVRFYGTTPIENIDWIESLFLYINYSTAEKELRVYDSKKVFLKGYINIDYSTMMEYSKNGETSYLLKGVTTKENLLKERESLLKKFLYNPQTNRYDYDGNLYKNDLGILVSEDKDGFIINFGKITENFNCYGLGLTSLKGAPTEVGRDFDCSRNQLTSLEGAPHTVGGGFNCSINQLTSLEGAPQRVGGYFNCSYNQLTSLEGAPQRVGGYFNCFRNQLISLKGAPKEVGEYFSCSRNQLTSLKGAPQKVGGDFSCYENHLTSLEGAPQTVGGGFYCYDNPNLHSLDYIGEVKGRIYKDF